MEFDEVLKTRRSELSFTDYVVSKSELKQIIEAGMWAPSSKNRQPWTFYVLKGKDKNQIADLLKEYGNTHDDENTALRSARVITEADTLILLYMENHIERNYTMDCLSMGACIENMALKAKDIGLGTLWLGDIVFSINKQIDKIIGENKRLIAGLCVGKTKIARKIQPHKTLQEVVKGGIEYVE